MTKLQLLTLERIKKLINTLHSELPVRMPFLLDDPDIDTFRQRVSGKDKESSKMWSEDNQAKREVIELLDALLSEPDLTEED